MWRGLAFSAEGADIRVAEVIAKHDNEVGLGGLCCWQGEQKGCEGKEDLFFHDKLWQHKISIVSFS